MKADREILYPSTTEPYRSQLGQFRKTRTPYEIYTDGARWTYLSGGEGDRTVLALHGGGGPAESLFRYIREFEKAYRVIAPTIPAGVSTVGAAIDGILAILDKEGVPSVHLFGVSNGGMIGQVLVRERPRRVQTLILFHTMLPSRDYASTFGRRARLMSLLPEWVIVKEGLRWLKNQIRAETTNARPGEQSFWIAYFEELYNSDLLTKEYFVSRAKLLTDYFKNYRFEPNDLQDWPGRVLIIESENDQVVSEFERKRLKRFYEQARGHTFRRAGHLGGGLFKVEETISLIEDFLKSA